MSNVSPFYQSQWFSTFLGGDTHFENEKLVTHLEYPNNSFVLTSVKLRVSKAQSLGLELFGDTIEKTRDIMRTTDLSEVLLV